MINKHGSAEWHGGLQDGRGKVTTESGTLEAPYGFARRFEGAPGTNPEELIGAAHASCFAMALSLNLGNEDLVADSIEARSTVSLEEKGGGFAITKVHIEVTAKVPDASDEVFARCAEATKTGCPVSKLLDCEITMDARLV